MSKELDKIKECLDFFCRRCNEQGFYSPPLQPIVKEAYEAIAALRSEPVAFIEHHKGGDNLTWERVDHPYAKATPLYAAPSREEQRECNPAPVHGQSKTGPTGSHPGAPTPTAEPYKVTDEGQVIANVDSLLQSDEAQRQIDGVRKLREKAAEPALSAEQHQVVRWLIERGSPARYLEASLCGHPDYWISEPEKADRFHSQESAENFINEYIELPDREGLRVVEHAFIERKPPPTPFERECADIDRIIVALGMTVEQARTEGGNLQVQKILNHMALRRST